MSRIYKRYPPEIKTKAVDLRKQGYSLYELRDLLSVRLATIQGWVKHVQLSPKAKKRIRWRILEGGKVARARAEAANRQKIENWKQGIQKNSRREISQRYLSRDFGRILCATLYACEGSKYPSARMLGFGNSDPQIIRFFLNLLRACFAIDEKKFRCEILYRCDQDWNILKRYWSRVTDIPSHQFYRGKPDERTRGKPTLREDYRGVCYVKYLNTTLQFTLQSIGEALMENAGKEMVEPEGVEPSHRQCH